MVYAIYRYLKKHFNYLFIFFMQEKRRKGDNEMRENHISIHRKPLTQINNRPACMDGEKHVSIVKSCQINISV